jgi:hypothetical protein
MKALLVAVGLLSVTSTMASAQYYGGERYYRERGPYYERPYGGRGYCEEARARVRKYYRDAVRWDGNVDQGERVVLNRLEAQADRACRGRRY